jgi:hypothetical protein
MRELSVERLTAVTRNYDQVRNQYLADAVKQLDLTESQDLHMRLIESEDGYVHEGNPWISAIGKFYERADDLFGIVNGYVLLDAVPGSVALIDMAPGLDLKTFSLRALVDTHGSISIIRQCRTILPTPDNDAVERKVEEARSVDKYIVNCALDRLEEVSVLLAAELPDPQESQMPKPMKKI